MTRKILTHLFARIVLLSVLLVPAAVSAQTVHVFPAEDTNNTFTGTNTFQNSLLTKLVQYTVSTLPSPGSAQLGLIAVVTDGVSTSDCVTGSGTTWALCSNNGSAWVSLGGGSTPTNCTSTVHGLVPTPPNDATKFLDGTCTFSILPFPLAIGPNPWYDITNPAYGARSLSLGTLPFVSGAVCTSGSPAINLSGGEPANLFVNGDGVIIYGCGPTPTMNTPSAPSLVSGVSDTMTVPYAAIASVAGATPYYYRLVSIDKGQGKSVHSPTATVNGPAALGAKQDTVTSCALTLNSMTCTLSAPDSNLAAGNLVHIQGSTDATLSHWLTIDTVTGGGTTVNFGPAYGGSPLAVTSLEGIASTGGTLSYFMGIKLAWTNSGTGIWMSEVCKSTDNVNWHYIGVSYPVNEEEGYDSTTQYVDWGTLLSAPPEAGNLLSDADCTGSGANDVLSTRILSGAPGTSLVVANNASQNNTAYIFADAAPNIAAAFVAARPTGGTVYIPAGNFITWSFLDLQSNTNDFNIQLLQQGGIYIGTSTIAPPRTWTGIPSGGIGLSAGAANPFVVCRSCLPAIYYGFQEQPIFIDHIALQAQGLSTESQANLFMFDKGGQNSIIKNSNFGTNQGDLTDYIGTGIIVRPGAFNTIFDNLAFASGPGNSSAYVDKTWGCALCFVPAQNTDPNGQAVVQSWTLHHLNFIAKGFYELAYGGDGGINSIDDMYSQGPITPMVAVQSINGSIGLIVNLAHFRPDSAPLPFFAIWNGVNAYLTSDRNLQATVEPGGQAATFTGVAPQTLNILGNTAVGNGPAINPQPLSMLTNSTGLGGGVYFANDYQDSGTSGRGGGGSVRAGSLSTGPSISFSGFAVPGKVPTLAVPSASAGGTIPAGDHEFCAHVVYPNGSYGVDSCQPVTIVGGTQTLDFSVTAVIGALGYQITQDQVGCLPSGPCTGLTMTAGTTTYHYTGGMSAGTTVAMNTAHGGGINGFDVSGFYSGTYYKALKATAPTCLVNQGFIWFDTTADAWKFCNDTGPALPLVNPAVSTIHNFNRAAQSQAISSGVEYYVTNSDLDMPAVYTTAIGAGTTMKWRIAMNKTAAGTGTFQVLLKKGANGTTADTAIVTQTIGTQTAAADNMEMDIQLTWTSTTAAYWTIIPHQSAASGTGFGLVYPAVAAQFNGTISGQTTTTASDKYGISVILTTGTPTIGVSEVQAEAFGVN